jgi:asparagine synthase (glutamine-hydrolysing)
VKPGQRLVYDLNALDIKHYSQINLEPPHSSSLGQDITETISQFENELKNSIDLRFAADAKVGVSLSGGVDSLLILSLLNKKKLNDTNFYTIFNDDSNEDYKYVKKLKDEINFKLTEIPFTYSHNLFENYLNILSQKIEIPVNFSATSIPTLIISEQMKKDKIKVCIDGIGGDEIMGGYPIFEKLSRANLRENKVFDSIKNLIRYYNYKKPKFGSFLYTTLSILYYALNKSKLSSEQIQNNSIIEIISNSEIKDKFFKFNNDLVMDKVLNLKDSQLCNIKLNLLPAYLGISDSVNMINSIESRSPFLDKRLYKYVFMSDNLKYKKGFNKYMLRKLLSSRIGSNYGFRKGKAGFTTFHQEKFLNEKKNLEIIFDSPFIRSIFSINDNNMIKDLNSFAKRQLLSLAYLDNNYNLNI